MGVALPQLHQVHAGLLQSPDTFPTYLNLRSMINNKAIQAMLALAVFVPMTANHFDLSVGYMLGISQVGLNRGDDAKPGTPGTGEDICPECRGTGTIGSTACPNCAGTGVVIEGVGGG